jgi:hypothetical protein
MYPRPRWTDLGMNPLLYCERSIADHPTHGMAQLIVIVRKNYDKLQSVADLRPEILTPNLWITK